MTYFGVNWPGTGSTDAIDKTMTDSNVRLHSVMILGGPLDGSIIRVTDEDLRDAPPDGALYILRRFDVKDDATGQTQLRHFYIAQDLSEAEAKDLIQRHSLRNR